MEADEYITFEKTTVLDNVTIPDSHIRNYYSVRWSQSSSVERNMTSLNTVLGNLKDEITALSLGFDVKIIEKKQEELDGLNRSPNLKTIDVEHIFALTDDFESILKK